MPKRWKSLLSLTLLLPIASLASTGTLTSPNPQQFSIHQVDTNPGDLSKLLVVDPSGNLFAVSSVPTASGSNIRIVKTDGSGNVLATFAFGGSATDTANAAAIGPEGNIVVVGTTTSPNFPLVTPIQNDGAAFVVKVDAQLTTILYSTLLGVPAIGNMAGSGATAVTLDSSGNIFVAGQTPPGFTTTPGALQTQSPPVPANGTLTNGFVVAISAAGDHLIFSTLYTGGDYVATLSPATVPFSPQVFTVPQAIALDSSGDVIIAGTTDANNLMVSANAYAQQCSCADIVSAGFIAKIGAAGTQLVWGTYFPGPFLTISAMALDSSDNVVIFGTPGGQFPLTANPIQSSGGGFVAEIDASGRSLIFSTYFGGNTVGSNWVHPITNGPAAVVIDSQGVIWVTGGSGTAALPTKSGIPILGQSYIAGISAGGTSLLSLFTAPDGAIGSGLAITPQGTIAALGESGSLLISSSTPGPSLMGIVELGAFQASQAVCARELVSFYGIGIGPATPQHEQITDGVIANSLGGTQVLFDGTPAALLFAGPTQINAIVPSSIAFQQTTSIQIVGAAGSINGPAMPVEETIPQVEMDIDGYAVAVNQDGTLNAYGNSAAPGSIVAIWLVGGGAASTSTTDDIINTALSSGQFSTYVLANVSGANQSLEIFYDGDAPTQPSGIVQVNFRLPETSAEYYEVQIGTGISPQFLLY